MPQEGDRDLTSSPLRHLLDLGAVFVTTATLLLAGWATVPAAVGSLSPTVVMSGSMAPLIRSGDIVLTAPATPEQLRPGAVLLFDDPGRPSRRMLHRLHEIGDDGAIVTRGDANRRVDTRSIATGDIRGVGRILLPYAGLPATWVRSGDLAALTTWLAVTALAVVRVGNRWPVVVGPVRSRRPRRRRRPATAVPLAAVALVAVSALPAHAALQATTTTTAGIVAAALSAPTSVTAECLGGVGGIEVTWPASGDGVTTGYEVQRQQFGSSQWQSVGSPTGTTYTDTAAVGLTVTYRVRSTAAGWSSAWSPVSDPVRFAVLGVCL